MSILSETPIGTLVVQAPQLSKVFEHYGLDYCCDGKTSLSRACLNKQLPLEELLQAIYEAEQDSLPEEALDLTSLSLTALINHLLETHHQYLYGALPQIETLFNKVVHIHGQLHPNLLSAQAVFKVLHEELLLHMDKEERILFPYCIQLEEAHDLPTFHCGSLKNPVTVMEREHTDAGELLVKLRFLCQDYDPPEGACATYRVLMTALTELELDLHQHVHKENNLLFPRVLQRAQALGDYY